MSQGIKTNTE